MSLSPAFLDELRARTSLSALISRSTRLQRAGREWKACCPFHKEKTASFTVSDEKHFYHCFGCGAHGDAISWLTDARGLPFMEAVKELADAAGMEVPAPDPRSRAQAERAAGLHDVMEAAAAWFAERLAETAGKPARDYLRARGVDADTQKRFGFGFAPDSRSALKDALARVGIERLVEAGLLVAPEDGGASTRSPYDRFRGRLMIPIRDLRGRIIAFGGRLIGPGEPKYLNSPDTPLFDKGRTLFHLDRAAPAARDSGRLIAVEGYMDVVALESAGLREVVAPLGTALTEAQLGLMWRLSSAPLLCFDGDSAGAKAAHRAALRTLPHVGPDRSLAFVSLPAGQDPDDLVRSGGRAALERLLADAEPLVDRLWRIEYEAEPLTTPERRAGLRRRLMDHVAAITDPHVREQYKAEWLNRFDRLVRPARPPWQGPRGRFGPPPVRAASTEFKAFARSGLDDRLGQAVLKGLARFPDRIGLHAEAVAALPISDPAGRRLRDLMLEAAMMDAQLDPEGLRTILATKEAAELLDGLNLQRGLAFSFTRNDPDPGRACRDLELVLDTLAARPEIETALEAATARLKEAGDEAAFQEQQRLRAARDEADRQLATLIDGEAD